MARYNYSAQSPYYDTRQTSWYLLPIELRIITPDLSDTVFSITGKYVNRPDLLSNDLYTSPAYWWVFMVRNMDVIRDPIWDFTIDTLIFLPTKSRLQSLLG